MNEDIPVGAIIKTFLIVIVAVLALSWVFMGNDFFLYKFFAPKQAAVQRQVFEQTKSFNQGMVQELENMQVEYVQAKDQASKDAIASIILHRASGYNLGDSAVTPDLRSFIQGLRNKQTSEIK